jgi:hypothetical protein
MGMLVEWSKDPESG